MSLNLSSRQFAYAVTTQCPFLNITYPEKKTNAVLNLNATADVQKGDEEYFKQYKWAMLCQDVTSEDYSLALQEAGFQTRIPVTDVNNESQWIHVFNNESMRIHYECSLDIIEFQVKVPGAYNCCCKLQKLLEAQKSCIGYIFRNKLNGGAIAAMIVIPVLAIIIAILGYLCYRNKKTPGKSEQYQSVIVKETNTKTGTNGDKDFQNK